MHLITTFFSSEYFILFLIITVGMIAGKAEIAKISLGSSAVLFTAMIFGHFGYEISETFRKIGLVFFIYTIGIQAGPGFFEAFRKSGKPLIITALTVILSAALTIPVLHLLFDIDIKIAVGLLTGALTSSPGLAAAIETTGSPLASIGYGAAYPFGVIVTILFIKVIPKILKVNLAEEEVKYESSISDAHPEITERTFLVENENIIGKGPGELQFRRMTGANIYGILRDKEALPIIPGLKFQAGDLVQVAGTEENLKKAEIIVGHQVMGEESRPHSVKYDTKSVLVTDKNAVNKSPAQMEVLRRNHATVTRIRRAGIDISPSPSSVIRFGDKLMITASKTGMKEVTDFFGNNVKRLSETDFLPISAGIIIGIILGMIEIPLFGNTKFNLGISGGVLISGIVLSRIGKTGPIIWNVSGPANQLLRQIGLLLFLAAVGTSAGKELVGTISQYGPGLFLAGFSVALIPMIITTLVGHYVFKINFLSLLGALAGGMTSTPGLSALDSMTESNAPQIAYATVYPFAMVFLIICVQVLVGVFG